jgi:ketosteroid isomerase-like protein
MKNLTCIFFTITSLTFFSCNNAHKVNLDAELQALRQADKTWSETATAKDVNGYVEFYDKDAFVIDFNGKITRGMEELRKMA